MLPRDKTSCDRTTTGSLLLQRLYPASNQSNTTQRVPEQTHYYQSSNLYSPLSIGYLEGVS